MSDCILYRKIDIRHKIFLYGNSSSNIYITLFLNIENKILFEYRIDFSIYIVSINKGLEISI